MTNEVVDLDQSRVETTEDRRAIRGIVEGQEARRG